MAFSMACRQRSCQAAGGDALDELAGFRRDLYRCLWRRADALFETMDAVLTAGLVPSLPYLSLDPAFRRGHGMVCQGLARGRVDEEALRDLLVRSRPAHWPCVFGIDASTIGRPRAVTSPGREFHHHSCAGHTGCGDPVIKGWARQWLSQLGFDADSWTAPHDAVQVGRDDAAAVTAAQILAHAARLRRHGETRIPLYVMDAGYDEAPVTLGTARAPGSGAQALRPAPPPLPACPMSPARPRPGTRIRPPARGSNHADVTSTLPEPPRCHIGVAHFRSERHAASPRLSR